MIYPKVWQPSFTLWFILRWYVCQTETPVQNNINVKSCATDICVVSLIYNRSVLNTHWPKTKLRCADWCALYTNRCVDADRAMWLNALARKLFIFSRNSDYRWVSKMNSLATIKQYCFYRLLLRMIMYTLLKQSFRLKWFDSSTLSDAKFPLRNPTLISYLL
jgi:hypothetical protein